MDALTTARSLWTAGRLSESYVLWGLEILWWGRFGKALQTLAIMVVVIELIGPQRLSLFGSKLGHAFTLERAKSLVTDARTYRDAWSRYMGSPCGSDEEKQAMSEQEELSLDNLHVALLLVGGVGLGYASWALTDSWWLFAIIATIAIGLFTWVAAYITSALIVTLSALGLILNMAFFTPIAWALSHPRLDAGVRLATLIAAIVGIHFDFLAS